MSHDAAGRGESRHRPNEAGPFPSEPVPDTACCQPIVPADPRARAPRRFTALELVPGISVNWTGSDGVALAKDA